MIDLISMWRSPKMVAYFTFTTALYTALLYPVSQFSLFGLQADYLRFAMCIPVAFGFLFGPAAAWGAGLGNLIFDATTNSGLTWISPLGFLGNFLIAYIPYALWTRITSEQPDMRSLKKIALFMGLVCLATTICGLVIGWGLLYLYQSPFIMLTYTIIASDTLWAVLLGPVVLAACYGYFNKRGLLYTDIMHLTFEPKWSKTRTYSIAVFVTSAALCFIIPAMLGADAMVLLPFVSVAFISLLAAIR
jgi:energy-coupling factor transport system substrate-specific component